MTRSREVDVPLSDTNVLLNCGRMSRREALARGALGLGGILLGNRLCAAARADAAAGTQREAKAKAVIQIWLSGGPPHTDTFDPKPESGAEYTGPLRSFLETNVSGIRIGEKLPKLAKLADKYSLVRGATHGVAGHETASYMMQTGRRPGGRLVYPAIGAICSAFKGFDGESKSLIPPYIVLTQPQGRFSEAGFMGQRYRPFATGGDPNAQRWAVEGIVAPGISDAEQAYRRDMLAQTDQLALALGDHPEIAAATQAKDEAYELIIGDAGKVFDLSDEKSELREEYGRNTLGQSCLAARRLVEAGVKYVTVNHWGWDTHKEHFQAANRLLPMLDNGLGALLADLSERGLLDSTLVWCCGEFGRTPKIDWGPPWNGGRHHHPAVFSVLVAGGGFKGGQVVGSSDSRGERVRDRPVYPGDLFVSIFELLGIDPDANLPHPMNEVIKAAPQPEEGIKLAGKLVEIM
jgi:hypothetical protein